MIDCPHCGMSVTDTRTFCPRCRKRLRPATAVHAAQVEQLVAAPVSDARLIAPSVPHFCSSCGGSPVAAGRFTVVRSYVVFFRWGDRRGVWCKDCALMQF